MLESGIRQKHIRRDEAHTAELKPRIAKADGTLTPKQKGIEKIIAGLTDLKQVRAVCG